MNTATSSPTEPVVDFASAAQVSLRDLQRRVGLEGWWVLRRNDHEHVVLAAIDSDFGQRAGTVVSWEDSYCRLTVEQGAPSIVPDIDDVACYAEARARNGLRARSLIVVPLTDAGGRVIGILRALGTQVRPDLREHQSTVQASAAVLAVLLCHELELTHASTRAARAEDVAHVDPLTGAGNRRAWDAALAEEEARCARHADQAAVVVLDLDGLKALNDSDGHSAGDQVLVSTAAVLIDHTRSADVVARLGGDEFGVLLPGTDVRDAWALARDLQQRLLSISISVSIGVAGRGSRTGLIAAWQQADTAMYVEKKTRRAERQPHSTSSLTALTPATRGASESSTRRATRPSVGSPTLSEAEAYSGTASATVPAQWRRAFGDANGGQPRSAAPANPHSAAEHRTKISAAPELTIAKGRDIGTVSGLLELVRRQLGAQSAYVSVFSHGRQHLRSVVSDVALPLQAGADSELHTSISWLIANGAIPAVCPDVAAAPGLRLLAARVSPVVGSYAVAALYTPDGEPCGSFGVFSAHPDAALSTRDVAVLRAAAEPLGILLRAEADEQLAHHRVLERLERLKDSQGLVMHFQPVVDLGSSRVVGAEALARFPGAELRPDQWFALAASVGAGVSLELQAASAALPALDDPRLPGFLAVNLSPEAACDPGLARLLGERPLGRLVVEITEHEEVTDYAQVHSALAPLRARGLRLAVDDVGAGYASMSHVLSLMPDFIKLDISLVRDIHADPGRQALAAAMTKFASAMGARVIAEGIENAQELTCLSALGVGLGQGYHLARPAPLLSEGRVETRRRAALSSSRSRSESARFEEGADR